ncbi:MAG: HesA/MoeB/ThiF family protein [Gammaproteobacteria bacterium]
MDSTRYARHIALPEIGESGQARIAAAKVLIVGLGGLGCPAAQYLATSGVGSLVLNDFDRVDESNLPRQILFRPADVGELKVDAARAHLEALNPAVNIRRVADRLEPEALEAEIAEASLVLDGSDNFATRLAVNRGAVRSGTPLVFGAALRFEGQVGVFLNDGQGPCYRCLYDDEDEWLGDCQGNGVLAPVPGVVGTIMAVEALKLLLGFGSQLSRRILLWDARSGDWQGVGLNVAPDCPECQAAAAS